jgi:hypothetical protein
MFLAILVSSVLRLLLVSTLFLAFNLMISLAWEAKRLFLADWAPSLPLRSLLH